MPKKTDKGPHSPSRRMYHFAFTQSMYNMLVQDVKEANEKRPPFLREMANNGWYLSPEYLIPDIERIASELKKDKKGAEDGLCDYFDNRVEELDKFIKAEYPARYTVVNEAFWAHTQHLYGLSVPVLLAQSEGICFDSFGEKLYSKSAGKPKLARRFTHLVEGTLDHNLVLQMIELFPLVCDDHAVPLGHLNRHRIMHGIDPKYGTRTNSCKAISLVDCVSWVAKKVKPNMAIVHDAGKPGAAHGRR